MDGSSRMDGSSSSEVTPARAGRPSTVAPYEPLVAQCCAKVRTFQASKSCGASGSRVIAVVRARSTSS